MLLDQRRSPYARARDARVHRGAARRPASARGRSPAAIVVDVSRPRTKGGRPFTVFTPFHRAWRQRRAPYRPPRARRGCRAAARPRPGRAPGARGPRPRRDASPEPVVRAGRGRRARALAAGCASGLDRYADRHDRSPAARRVLSPLPALGLPVAARVRGARARAGGGGAARSPASSRGATSTPTCCCTIPDNARHEFQERYRATLRLGRRRRALAAWQEGRTGYPLVDAGMRQLRATRLDAQPRAAGRRLVPDEGPAPRLARGRAWFSAACSTASRRRTTATGSGSPRSAWTRRRTSGGCYNPTLQQQTLRPRRRVRAPLGARAARRARRRGWPSRGR